MKYNHRTKSYTAVGVLDMPIHSSIYYTRSFIAVSQHHLQEKSDKHHLKECPAVNKGTGKGDRWVLVLPTQHTFPVTSVRPIITPFVGASGTF